MTEHVYAPETKPETKPAPALLRPVQAFVNTRDLEEGTDEFADPRSLAAWFSRVGLVGDAVEATDADLERAVALREALRSVLAANNGGEVDPRAVETLNLLAGGLRVGVGFDERGKAQLSERPYAVEGVLGHILGLVLCACADGTWGRLKACGNPECRWVFYDASKNRVGTWCDMAVCGNRSKGRAHRERQKARIDEPR